MAKGKKTGKKRVTFSYHAPHADLVCVAGTFNDWDSSNRPMKKKGEGNWKCLMYLPTGTYEYRFVVDGVWTDDPQCLHRRPNQYGGVNCILEIP